MAQNGAGPSPASSTTRMPTSGPKRPWRQPRARTRRQRLPRSRRPTGWRGGFERRSELPPLDLSRGSGSRQPVGDDDARECLNGASDPPTWVRSASTVGGLRAVTERHDHGRDDLSPDVVVHADHRHLRDAGETGDGTLDFDRCDVLAARTDRLRTAADDIDVTVVVWILRRDRRLVPPSLSTAAVSAGMSKYPFMSMSVRSNSSPSSRRASTPGAGSPTLKGFRNRSASPSRAELPASEEP